MGVIDFILNIAGLLLWLNWRSNRLDPLVRRMPATLMGTLRPAAPQKLRRWHLLAFIALLLLVRALIYWWIGSQNNWAGKLYFGVVVLWFSSNTHWLGFCHMVAFSFFSYGLTLGVFYICLMVLSLLAGPLPIHGLVAIPLGKLDDWPKWAKASLPFFGTAIGWFGASYLLNHLEILPPVPVAGHFQQSMVIGLSSYLLWEFPLGAILLLHLVNSYIYFGKHPFWKYVNATAQTILRPFRKIPLQAGRVDFAPLVALAVLFLVGHFAARGFSLLYARLPW